MPFRRSIPSIILAVVIFTFSLSIFAQSTGSIRGTVTDSTGSVIPNAALTLTESNTQISRTAASNSDGIFVFPDQPTGNYILRVSAPGFASSEYPGLTLVTGHVSTYR